MSYVDTVNAKSPLFFYGFQDAALATEVIDLSAHAENSTDAGNNYPTFQAGGPTINGTVMKAAEFDGAADVIFCRAAVATALSAVLATTWSMSCWVYSTFGGSGWDSIIGTSFNGLWIPINGTTADADDNVGAAKQGVGFPVTARPGLPGSTWKHVCVTRNSATWKIYVNGVDVSTAGSDQTLATLTGVSVGAGYDGSHDYFAGRLAYVAMFDTTLSGAEVLAQYNASAAPPINTVAPAVTGTARPGSTLSCSTGTWSPTGDTYTYQWKYDDGSAHNIAGATSSTWAVDISGAVDVDDTVYCVVTATNGGGAVAATSNSKTVLAAPAVGGNAAQMAQITTILNRRR